MLKRLILAAGLLAATALPAAAQGKTFYWISHGSPADPVWTYFLAGAEQWAEDTGNTVNTSFHSGDVPSHQEAVRAAIAAKADGIVTSAPIRAAWWRSPRRRTRPKIPIININTPDPTASFDAYVGGDNVVFGADWAQYLVDKGLVKSGDFVWMPVEVPGATYGVQEEEGITSVFEPAGITWEVTDATLDQAEIITRMSDYLTANREKVKAIIGLGDLVTGSIKRVFDQVGVKPGEIPVVGWGNSLDTTQEVLNGYVNAGAVAGPAGDELCRAVAGGDGGERHPAGLRRHHRRALREGHRADLRRHPVGQVAKSGSPAADSAICGRCHARVRPRGGAGAARSLPHCQHRTPRRALTWNERALIQRLIAQARVRAVRAARRGARRLHGDQPRFLSPQNISNTLVFTVELGLIALAMTLLMTSGEFDLSVGSVFGFSPVLMWTLFNAGVASLEVAFLVALVAAALIGLVNGLFVTRLEIPSFLVTLGMLLVVRGTALFITDGFPQRTWNAAGHWLAEALVGDFYRRPVPHLHVALLVHRRRARAALRADADQGGQLDPGLGRQSRRGAGPRRQRRAAPRWRCSCSPR